MMISRISSHSSKSTREFLVDELIAILETEADYIFLARYITSKLLIPRREAEVLIPEEALGICKDHRSEEVALYIQLFWDQLRHLRIPGVIGYMYAAQCYDRVVHSVASISEQYWVIPLHKISISLSTLQVMKFFLRTVFVDLDIFMGVEEIIPFKYCDKGMQVGRYYGYGSALIS